MEESKGTNRMMVKVGGKEQGRRLEIISELDQTKYMFSTEIKIITDEKTY